jgi:hypothetical protein
MTEGVVVTWADSLGLGCAKGQMVGNGDIGNGDGTHHPHRSNPSWSEERRR